MAASSSNTFRLTASVIASHFKHRCDRLFRWNAVATSDRGKAGIGWGVPRRTREHSRPGIALLMEAGDEFELGRIAALEEELCNTPQHPALEPQVYHSGFETSRGRDKVKPLPFADAVAAWRQPAPPRFTAQIDLDPAILPGVEDAFLADVGLTTDHIALGVSRPDLIEVLPADPDHPLGRLRVWDFKGSQVARHEHFIQVAYYTMLLEAFLTAFGVTDLEVDTTIGVIESRKERVEFELAPYRLALNDFLRNRVPVLLAIPAAQAHFHVHEGCMLCEYMDECRSRADAGDDLSRIPYITSESKRHLLAAGYRNRRDLACLHTETDIDAIAHVRSLSHDLSANVARYIAAAQALDDGRPRPLETSTFQMPAYEDIRIVLCAEQDSVTGTCFALGIKTYEGWDDTAGRPIAQEQVFIAEERDSEASILLQFLQTLNRLLERVHAENAVHREQDPDVDPDVIAVQQQVQAAEQVLAGFRSRHESDMRKRNPQAAALRAQRDALVEQANAAKKALKDAKKEFAWKQRRAQKRLHFYIYDTLDALALKGLVERHLFDAEPPELLSELANLVRLFPPESVLPDADTFRTIPATIVIQMLRSMVALPVAYSYDLRTVSEVYQPAKGGFRFGTPYGFSWEHSNQIAFERIHDVWNGKSFSYNQRGSQRVLNPSEIKQEIEKAVLAKLRATDSVVRRLKEDMRATGQLLLRKEPFQLYAGSDPLNVQMLEALRIFTSLEVSLSELATKQTHTLPVSDRVASFVCLNGLKAETDVLDDQGTMWFTFNPAALDTKLDPGDFNLVLTPVDEPLVLLSDIDGELFNSSSRWRFAAYKVKLIEFDFQMTPPRVRLEPDNRKQFLEKLNSQREYVLDQLFIDYNSTRVFDVLKRLADDDLNGGHVQALLAEGTIQSWQPVVTNPAALEQSFRNVLQLSGADPDSLLNAGQWRAWRGVLREPLTLVWGPPGTGKTHTIAHILIGYALAARFENRPLRILVSAFTHHAINNVLKKVAELAERYNISVDDLVISKMQRGGPSEADMSLPARVGTYDPDTTSSELEAGVPCMILGGTVWAVHRAMKAAGDSVQSWFDVVMIDEASQMKLPDALIAFSASKPISTIILAGDDRQLPPIIHGDYPEEHAHLLTSVFAFVRGRIDRQRESRPDLEQRILFQLEENFRMNAPLTAYPRDVLYNGRFYSTKPGIRVMLGRPIDVDTDDLVDFLLHPDRPVVLVRYTPPRTYTARNPLEAELATHLALRLRDILYDQDTNVVYTPQGYEQTGIAILSPHRAQNSTIRNQLRAHGFGTETQPMPLVDTVDKLQGQERDVIIVSYGVADGEYAEQEAEFLLSSNRFNVAATRARHKLIVLCADTVLDVVPTDQQVLLDAMMLKQFRRYCSDGARSFQLTDSQGDTVVLHVQWKGFDT